MTIKRVAVGTATSTNVYLFRDPLPGSISDRGSYRYYAGPVYLYQPRGCIHFSGAVRNTNGRWGEGEGDLVPVT